MSQLVTDYFYVYFENYFVLKGRIDPFSINVSIFSMCVMLPLPIYKSLSLISAQHWDMNIMGQRALSH